MEYSTNTAAKRPSSKPGHTIQLPAAISWYSFKPIYLLIWLPYILVYQITNRFPLFEPTTLPLTDLDNAIPFVPQLLPLYVSYLVFYFATVSRMENDREVNRLFYATHLELLISATIFIVLPVRMPRELYYQPEIYNWADAFWRWFDAPNNCLPSLHASNCLLLMQFNWQRRGRWLFTVLGISIIASTLFVKQHYVVDLVAGASVYLIARWFLGRLKITGIDKEGSRVDRFRAPSAANIQPRANTHPKQLFRLLLVLALVLGPTIRGGLRGPDQINWSDPAAAAHSGYPKLRAAAATLSTLSTGYTGSGVCATCHDTQYEAWENSAHAWAMKSDVHDKARATFEPTPIAFGDSGSIRFPRSLSSQVTVEVSEQDNDEELESGERDVVYLFGNRAIEQHLILDHDGRYQALPVGFDLEKQEWFDLFPGDARGVEDWGHWSNRGMTANSECIVCHTTGFEKGYDTAKDSYQTTWAELGVGCEACHGPGATHVEEQRNAGTEGSYPSSYGMFDTATTLETCAPCHSLRREVWPGFVPGGVTPGGQVTGSWLNYFEPVLLDEPEFHFDGQLSGEAYEWASFLQSRMHREGVTCSNCHEIHSGALKQEGNALCVSCHEPKFASIEHTHHASDNEGALCVNCHMPKKVFMARDVRRDHSLGVPDPVQNATLGTPNVCTGCHEDKDGDWAAEHWTMWWGPATERQAKKREIAEAFALARSGQIQNVRTLVECLDGDCEAVIERATAAKLLTPFTDNERVRDSLIDAFDETDDLVRGAAVWAIADSGAESEREMEALTIAATDPLRTIRLSAAWGLRHLAIKPGSDDEVDQPTDRAEAAFDELVRSYQHQGEYAESHHTLGIFHEARSSVKNAETSYRSALRIAPTAVPPRYNLARMLARQDRTDEAISEFEQLVEADGSFAPGRFALGLAYGDAGDWREAVRHLTECLKLSPYYPDALYNLGHAYVRLEQAELANHVLEQALTHPRARVEALRTLVSVNLEIEDRDTARHWAKIATDEIEGFSELPEVKELLSENEQDDQDQEQEPSTAALGLQ